MSSSSLSQGVIRGGVYVGCGFVGQQGLAVIRTMVLARLLTPEDFGQLSIVMVTIFAGLMLTEFSLEGALLQKTELPDRYIHAAWTIMAIRGAILFILVQMVAPWIAAMFDHPEVEVLLRVGSMSFLFVSFSAVSMTLLLRELRYRSRVILDVAREFVGGFFAIALALWIGNVWALLIGFLIGQMIPLLGTWFFHSYRPRVVFDREAFSHYWEFGRHLYFSGVLTYLITRGAYLTVGKLRGLEDLGHYQMVAGIAEMVTRGVSGTVSQVVLPAYTRLTTEGRNLVDAFEEVWRILLYLLLPLTAILSMFHSEVVELMLGDQWLSSSFILAILLVGQAIRAFAASCGTFILSSGRTYYLSRIKCAEAVCFMVLIVPFTKIWGLVGAASCSVIVSCVSLVAHIYAVHQVTPIIKRVLKRTSEPLVVTLTCVALVWQVVPEGLGYSVICMILWSGIWGGYIWLRQEALLRKIWIAIYHVLPRSPDLKGI